MFNLSFKNKKKLYTIQLENGESEKILAKNYSELRKIINQRYPESKIQKKG